MNRVSKSLAGAVLAALLCLPAASPASADQFVVIESTAPGIATGTVLQSGQSITLPAGARVSLVSDRGTVATLTGPFSGVPPVGGGGASDPTVVDAISSLFAQTGPRAQSWGTFRGESAMRGEGGDAPSDVWTINLQQSERICLPAGTAPRLWRAAADGELLVVLVHVSSGREAYLRFADGVQDVAWPGELPLIDGGEYALRDTGYLWERHLALRVIPDGTAAGAHQVAWMADTGCFRQARLLLSQLK